MPLTDESSTAGVGDDPELQAILDALVPVSSRFAELGHDLYLVGGVVRDLLAGLPLRGDIDLTTGADPATTLELVADLADAIWTQGERFGTIGARIGGRDIEITTFRSESYDPASRKPVVIFGHDLETDLSRRDFTINAMAISIADGRLIDPFGGRNDLAARILRTPIDADASFADDPLRLLRAARFVARFGLAPAAELGAAASRNGPRLAIVSAERIHDEFERLLGLVQPRAGLEFLADHDLLGALRPMPRSSGADIGAVHRASVTLDVEERTRRLVRRAGFFLDLGAEATRRHLVALRYGRAEVAATVTTITLAPRFGAAPLTAADVRRIVHDAGRGAEPDLVDAALFLSEVLQDPGQSSGARDLLEHLRHNEDLTDLEPPIDGHRIITLLGLEPGPMVGRVLDALRRHRLEHGPYSAAEAEALLPGVAGRLGLPPPGRYPVGR